LILLVPTLIGLSILTFVISRVVPADPAKLAAGPRATPDMVQTIRDEYGLDDPLVVQYVTYVGGLLRGDFGESILTQRAVADDLRARFPATLELVLAAMILAIGLAVPLGIIAAVYQNRWPDQLSRIFAISAVSVPRFWFGIVLQLTVASSLGLLPLSRRFPTLEVPPEKVTGFLTIDALLAGDFGACWVALKHLVMPATVLAIGALAIIMRTLRGDMLEALGQDYVRSARAKGLVERRVVLRHVLPNAFIPSLTMIGLSFGWTLGGTILVETVFDWPGLGDYAVKAAVRLDFDPIMGVTLLIGVCVILLSLAVDLLYGFLDPRITYR
jgi:peptide/nickel transport system permease protein